MRNVAKDEKEMAARREAMLREGFRLFAKKGIEPVTMQEVANACGVGIATLYRYYNAKPLLVIDIATKKWEEFAEYVNLEQIRRNVKSMNAAETAIPATPLAITQRRLSFLAVMNVQNDTYP